MLVGVHEQTPTSELSYDELALLSRHWGAIGSSPMARAALKQRGSLMIWFDPETQWLGAPSGKRGRSATFSDAAIQGVPDAEGAVRAAIAADHRAGGKPVEACRARLGGAGLQHTIAPSERSERRHPVSPQHWRTASFDRHRAGKRHRFERTGERVMARDFDRQVAELQIRAFAGSLGPVAFTRSLHEPLHGPRSAANSTRGMDLFNKRENSTSD